MRCRGSVGVPHAATTEIVVEGEEKRKEEGRVLKVGLICGGPSSERGISLNSARSVLDHIQVIRVRMYVWYGLHCYMKMKLIF